MNNSPLRSLMALALITFSTLLYQPSTCAQGTAFTYQGFLADGGAPANGAYDLTFTLYDRLSGGNTVGASNVVNDLSLTNGLFTVALDFGGAAFDGNDRWLEIAVRPGASTDAYTNVAPRQPITATPYAMRALSFSGAISNGQLAGTYGNAVNITNAANVFGGSFSGNGGGLTNLNAASLVGPLPAAALSNAWRIGGNNGTIVANNFIGTTDNQPLEIRVNNSRVLRLQPDASPQNAPNVIGGSPVNIIAPGIVGATIAGGGSADYEGNGPAPNTVGTSYGAVGGGVGNDTAGVGSTVGGGYNNTSFGFFATVAGGGVNLARADYAFVGGGLFNQATNTASTIAGGQNNRALGTYSSVGGGTNVQALGSFSTASGGKDNLALVSYSTVGGGLSNTSSSSYATVGGGNGNQASGSSSTVSGGIGNISSGGAATVGGGNGNESSAVWATVGGGLQNISSGSYATVGGGRDNRATNSYATVGGGWENESRGPQSTVAGGRGNVSSGGGATVSGGYNNNSSGGGATVGGGNLNTNSGAVATLGGGFRNTSSAYAAAVGGGADNQASAEHATVGGGHYNEASGTYSTVGGGRFNYATTNGSTVAGGYLGLSYGLYSTVSGGSNGHASGAYSTVAGGRENFCPDFATTVSGGDDNRSIASWATVGGGLGNLSSGIASTVGGGLGNSSTGVDSVVGGGRLNESSGFAATIPGGVDNVAAGDYSLAAGRRAIAFHTGTFVWADSQNADFASTASQQFLIRAAGGVGIGHTAPDAPLHVVGGTDVNLVGGGTLVLGAVSGLNMGIDSNEIQARNNSLASSLFLNAGGGNVSIGTATANARLRVVNATCDGEVWNNSSDRNLKAGFETVDPQSILAKVSALPISRWHYTNAPGTRHIGPMAQDFQAAFRVGSDDKHIATIDADGVALAAIQGLNAKLELELKAKDVRITALEQGLAELRQLLLALQPKTGAGQQSSLR